MSHCLSGFQRMREKTYQVRLWMCWEISDLGCLEWLRGGGVCRRWRRWRGLLHSTYRPIRGCSVHFSLPLSILKGIALVHTDHGSIDPKSIAISAAALQGEMICIHGRRLACIVTRFIGILVVHVKRNPNLREDARMVAHVVYALSSNGGELVSEAVPDCCLPYFDSKCR